jgi:hypothetical protein
VTYTRIYDEIIAGTGCGTGATCHQQEGLSKLRMVDQAASYTALVGVKAMGSNLMSGMNSGGNCVDSGVDRVKAGDPDNSLFLQKISGTQKCGMSMPLGGTLMPDQIKMVRTWIMNGAKND